MDSSNLYLFGLDHESDLIKSLKVIFQHKTDVEVHSISGVQAALKFENFTGVFLFKVRNKKDLQDAVIILKKHKQYIQKGYLKPACILYVKNQRVEQILRKYSCRDFVDRGIAPKSFSFKIDFWFKGILKLVEKDSRVSFKNNKSETGQAEELTKEAIVNSRPPLEINEDFWLQKAKNQPKKVLGKWIAKIQGPSSFVVSWTEVEGDDENENCWKLVARSKAGEDFVFSEGSWYFSGEAKPDFNWKENKWVFTGKYINLFYKAEDRCDYRFYTKNEILYVTKDSNIALNWENNVVQTFEGEYSFDRNNDKQKEEANLEGEKDQGSYLKGKNQKEHRKGPLKGKLEDAEQSIEDLLSKSGFEVDADDLKGSSNFTDDEIDDLDGESNTENLDGLMRSELTPLEKKSKNNNNANEADEIDGNLSGKLSSQEKNQEEKQKESNVDDIDGNLRNELQPLKPLQKNNDSNKEFTESDNGPLDGKSTTDDIDGRLRSPNLQKEKQKKTSDYQSKQASTAEDAIDDFANALQKKLENAVNPKLSPSKQSSKEKNQSHSGDNFFDHYKEADELNLNLESGEVETYISFKGKQQKYEVNFDELYEDEAVFKTNEDIFNAKDLIHAHVILTYGGKSIVLEFDGEISHIEKDEITCLYIKATNLDAREYEKFVSLYQERQEHIVNFFSHAKGVA